MRSYYYTLTVLALVLTGYLMFNACSIDNNNERLDKTALQNKIADAKAERNNTVVNTSENNVLLGRRWVSQQVMTAFETAISSAELTLTSATTQTELNSEAEVLHSALVAFKNAKREGNAAPADAGALADKIAEAENAKTAVVASDIAENVAIGMQWVTHEAMNTFSNAINAAKAILNTNTIQSVVNSAILTLDNAINTFIWAVQSGNKASDFTAEELIMLIENAKAIKENIKTSNNGNDVSPADSWVSENILNALNAAIVSAENADETIDSQYMALLAAMNTFNNAKKNGTVPNKTNLYNAIISADNAKEGIAEAASAAQAPYGFPWATVAQWTAFNTAYNNAVTVYDNANSSQAIVTAETTALNAAIRTFKLALQANGPGTRQNTITITGFSNAQNGKAIIVSLFSTLDGIDGSFAEPAIHGFGEITNGEVTVTLMWFGSSDFWVENGSRYAGLTISDDYGFEPNTQFFIRRSTIDFTTEAYNPTVYFSDFEELEFSFRLGDMVGDAIFNGSQMTFNELFTAIGGVDFDTLLPVMEELGIVYYKDKGLTQAFTGSDLVGADTMIYTVLPYSL